ncbi:MAG: hypothetical protein M3380_18645, partial [Chloroflexota bacterium]|nr:hypothetical protein [Chloroflexota bacterium]
MRPIARPFWNWLQRWVLLWERPAWSAAFALALYTLLAIDHRRLWSPTADAYFNYLADAFLHGQLHLRLLPRDLHDLALFQGRYYLYWPPFPAILLMPFVAVFGVQFSDIIFTLGIAALNVALVALLLRQACRRRLLHLSRIQRGLLILFFALGTVHVTLAPFGRVWFTGQLVGFACVALAYLATLSLRATAAFTLTGVALAGALLTRNHLLLVGLWPAIYLLQQHRTAGWRRLLGYTLAGLTPILLAVVCLALYNWRRFGSAFDLGLDYHRMHAMFVDDYRRYGAFHLHYVPTNLFYQYVAYPFPLREESYMGGSLFLLSPVFCAAGWAIVTGRPRWSTWTLLGTSLLVATPILLLMGTGWVQFGPRYTLDFTVPLLLLTAMGVQRWPMRALALLTALSVI